MTVPPGEPWVAYEDADVLAVVKPSGVNTHRADEHAQDGMYEWVQRQRPGTALSILHRLDKGTSGLLLFGRTPSANRALAAQFEGRAVDKRYELLVARDDQRPAALTSTDPVGGAGRDQGPLAARTDFERRAVGPRTERFDAHPRTGRTHQVRVHAAALGMPILGDREHGGVAAPRLYLHAACLGVDLPGAGHVDLVAPRPHSFELALDAADDAALAAPALAAQAALEARATLFDPADTDCYLWIDRHHDGFPEVRVERLGETVLVLDYATEVATGSGRPGRGGGSLRRGWLDAFADTFGATAVYEQHRPRGGGGGAARRVAGTGAAQFAVTELGLRYLIDLEASATSTGLFLDQRETRRALRTAALSGARVLNVFAHTGSLSVAAAAGGAETLTLDLSPRYLDWARRNLAANDIDPGDHDFIYGDALEWMVRLQKKGHSFDVVLADPPSSSTTGRRGGTRWVAERDLHVLVERSARLTAPGGSLYLSTNLHRMRWPRFLKHLARGLAAAGRTGLVETRTLPLDHRSGPGDPPYLKAAWVRLDGAAA